ncbi:hypothetical protein BpHYR1_014818 [Brachionus plicatilis]|uniref:Uncharacterized protein n=1 Tax=Brachionus plicatilis TaxID=10195 RepID=A0A3M7P5T8_BRAPC|nr:hypothetical protein BpHYR1_014818 [Brachionus plicatilis]
MVCVLLLHANLKYSIKILMKSKISTLFFNQSMAQKAMKLDPYLHNFVTEALLSESIASKMSGNMDLSTSFLLSSATAVSK